MDDDYDAIIIDIMLPKRDGVGQGTESLICPSKTTHDLPPEDVIRVFDRF